MPAVLYPPAIDLSAGFMSGLPARIFRSDNATTYNNPAISGLLMQGQQSYGCPHSEMYLMKGTVPTDFSTLTAISARSADILVAYSVPNGDFTPTQQNVNPAIISTVYSNAVASGTATWFWWVTRPTYSFDNPDSIVHQIFGTVGVTGSGADLEMGSTSVQVGQPYRILNIRINFPSYWTV
jgi:hypothetical protein